MNGAPLIEPYVQKRAALELSRGDGRTREVLRHRRQSQHEDGRPRLRPGRRPPGARHAAVLKDPTLRSPARCRWSLPLARSGGGAAGRRPSAGPRAVREFCRRAQRGHDQRPGPAGARRPAHRIIHPGCRSELGQGSPPIQGRETLMGMATRLQPRTAAFASRWTM